MALGTVRASGGLQSQLVSDQSSDIASQGLSGLGDAVNRLAQAGIGYLNSKTDIERIYDQRAQASQGLELDTRFVQYQQDRAKEFTEFSRSRSEAPGGMTKDYDALLAEREAEFLKTVPPRFQDAAKAKLAQDRATRVGSAFSSELQLLDTVDTKNLDKGLNTLGSGLKGGSISLEDAEARWAEMVMGSGLPDIDKQTFIDSGKVTLQGLEFGTIIEQGAAGYGAVADGSSGDDVVAAGLVPQQRAVLNVIAANESPGYNVWNGGTTFEGYEDHPAATSKAPGESTAAGRYQFILGTWRAATASYERKYGVKVPNFSPEWQDRVALHWAEHQFNAHHTGASFQEILASGDPQQLLIIRDVLGKPRSSNPNDLEWQGLGHMSDAEFIEIMTGEKGFAGGGTGPATAPNVWTDPRFADLPLDQKQSFANAAAAAAEQQKQAMATQMKIERDTFLDQAYNAGYVNDPAVLSALQNTPGWDAEAQARYNAGQEVFRATERGVSSVGESLAAGTPLAKSDLKAFGNWFGADGFAGIVSGAQDAYDKMRWAVGQARVFPEGSVDSFAAALGNPQTAPSALEFLAAAYAGDSSILARSGFSKDTIADVNLFRRIAERSGSQEQAYQEFTKAKDAEARTGKSETQLATEATKLFTESYPSAAELVDQHFDGWFSGSPNTTLNENTEGQLMLDATTAFQDGYKIYGTSEGAQAYMEAALENMWGVTQTKTIRGSWGPGDFGGRETTKGVLMKYPPERYYVAHDGDYSFLYRQVSEFAAAGGASPDNAVLMADDQTAREVREGKSPTYIVIGMGEYGEAMVLPGRFGGESLQESQNKMFEEDAAKQQEVSKVGSFLQQAARIGEQISALRTSGAAPEAITELEKQKLEAERQAEVAVLAARENGFIIPPQPVSPNDPIIANTAEQLGNAMTADPTMPRRIAALEKKYSGLPPDEARRMALAEIAQKEMRITKEAALAAVDMMLGAQQ